MGSRNVVDCAFVFNAKRSSHGDRLRNYDMIVNTKVQN